MTSLIEYVGSFFYTSWSVPPKQKKLLSASRAQELTESVLNFANKTLETEFYRHTEPLRRDLTPADSRKCAFVKNSALAVNLVHSQAKLTKLFQDFRKAPDEEHRLSFQLAYTREFLNPRKPDTDGLILITRLFFEVKVDRTLKDYYNVQATLSESRFAFSRIAEHTAKILIKPPLSPICEGFYDLATAFYLTVYTIAGWEKTVSKPSEIDITNGVENVISFIYQQVTQELKDHKVLFKQIDPVPTKEDSVFSTKFRVIREQLSTLISSAKLDQPVGEAVELVYETPNSSLSCQISFLCKVTLNYLNQYLIECNELTPHFEHSIKVSNVQNQWAASDQPMETKRSSLRPKESQRKLERKERP